VVTGARQSLESVVEEVRQTPKWASFFRDFPDPYLRLTASAYAELAEGAGFRVLGVTTSDHAWDFRSRPAFAAFCAVGCVEWTRRLPETERSGFIEDVLQHYRAVAANGAAEENTFKFYQMNIGVLKV